MGEITQESHFEMLEKLPDGNFKIKYPKVKSKSGVTFDELLTNKISAGTGLLGGGDLSRDRELKVNFGTRSTQVARGNHGHGGYAEIITGSYVGDGTKSRLISLGFKPKIVFVDGNYYSLLCFNSATWYSERDFIAEGNDYFSITSNGFEVKNGDTINKSGKTYNYIAIK